MALDRHTSRASCAVGARTPRSTTWHTKRATTTWHCACHPRLCARGTAHGSGLALPTAARASALVVARRARRAPGEAARAPAPLPQPSAHHHSAASASARRLASISARSRSASAACLRLPGALKFFFHTLPPCRLRLLGALEVGFGRVSRFLRLGGALLLAVASWRSAHESKRLCRDSPLFRRFALRTAAVARIAKQSERSKRQA